MYTLQPAYPATNLVSFRETRCQMKILKHNNKKAGKKLTVFMSAVALLKAN